MKSDSFVQTSFCFIILACHVQHCFAQIIGSSVVTSVSVVLGNENKDEVPTTTTPPSEDEEGQTTESKPEGVMSVIATLKDIVEQEQLKHDTTKTTVPPDSTPRVKFEPKISLQPTTKKSAENRRDKDDESEEHDDDEDDDDDDEEDDDDEADDFVEVTLSLPTTTTEAPKANGKSGNGGENDTATSAEVNEAIQKISGALLLPGKGESDKPLENIVTDVLTSINDARNSTATSSTPSTTTTSTTTAKTTTTRPPPPPPPPSTTTLRPRPKQTMGTTTTFRPSRSTTLGFEFPVSPARTALRSTLRPPTTAAPNPLTMHKKTMIPQLGRPMHSKIPGIPMDDNMTGESETEEEFFMDEKLMTTMMAGHGSSKTTNNPLIQGMNKKQNMSTSSNRPGDFYDDEIFGYDPYQTFLHGVYVPVVEMGEGEDTRDALPSVNEAFILPTTTLRSPEDHEHAHITGFRPSQGVKTAASHTRKPVPHLPDHLHRPRPSHIQYQHGVAEDVEPDTGLLAVKRPTHGSLDDNNFSVDRLTSQPRPLLPRPIVDNYTNHHNLAHHGHGHDGHGHGHHGQGGHGHDGHGAHGHHSHDAHGHGAHGHHHHHDHGGAAEKRPSFNPAPPGNPGLEATVTDADPEMRSFIDINNRLALRLFSSVTNPVTKAASSYNNMILSPFAIISALSMLFLGARGSTASQLDGLLQLDDMVTFNPHMLYNNITQSFLSQPNTAAALIRLLIADKTRGDVLEFFKTRVQHFYDARVEEADYKFAGHLAQSIINQMTRAQIQRHSYEMLNSSLPLRGPMSILTSAFFDGQFSGTKDQSVDSMDFIHLAALGRRLIRVPAVAFKDSLRAAYDKDLDATAVEVPYSTRDLSLILLMPGRPGEFAIGGVSSLKSRLTLESWHGLMRGFYPRDPFKVVFPRFSHQSTLNLTYTMQRMGLTDMFAPSMAKFKGINGLSDLYLDNSMMHFAEFGTWEKLSDTLTESSQQQNNKNLDLIRILRPHVREHYGNYGEPMTVNDWIFMSRNPSLSLPRIRSNPNTNPRPRSTNENQGSKPEIGSYARVRQGKSFKDALVSSFNPSRTMSKVYYFRQEPAYTEEETVLRFERPFVYILRHNPTGMIIMTGQYTEPVTDEHH